MTFGEPLQYTVAGGTIYFVTPPSSDFSGRNIWLDYYKTITRADSDGDSISVNDPYLIQLWVECQIKKKKNGGILAADDNSWLEYRRRKVLLVQNEISGQNLRLVPSVPNSSRHRWLWWRS